MAKVVIDVELRLLDEQIKNAQKRLEDNITKGNVKGAIVESKELNSLLNKRYRKTKDIADLRKSINYKDETRQLKEQLEIEKQIQAQYRRRKEKESGLSSDIRKTNKELESQGATVNKLTNLLSSYFSLYTVFNIGRKIAETTGYFEQQQTALEGILGSASAAQKAINQIKGLAIESPFQTKQLITFTKQLSAFGVETDKLVGTMKELADISAGLGVDMDRIILAYGQVRSATVLRGQELRQFTEAGIPLLDKLAGKLSEANGKLITTKEVFQYISDRKVPFEMVASVLSDMTAEGGKFYKMQERLTDTLYGQIEKMKDMWTLALNELGGELRGVMMSLVQGVQKAIKHAGALIGGLSAVAILREVRDFEMHTKSILRTKRQIKVAARAVRIELSMAKKEVRAASAGTAKWGAILKGVKRTAGSIWTLLKKLSRSQLFVMAIGMVAGAIGDVIIEARELKREIQEIDTAYTKDTKRMINGFDSLIRKLHGAAIGTKAYNDALSTLRSNYGQFLNEDMIEALAYQKEGWDDIAKSVRAAIEEINRYKSAVDQRDKYGEKISESLTEGHWYTLGRSQVGGSMLSAGAAGALTRESLQYFESNKDEAIDMMELAFKNLFQNGGSSAGDLKREIKSLHIDSMLEEVLTSMAPYVFMDLTSFNKNFKRYQKLQDVISNSPFNQVQEEFDNAIRRSENLSPGLSTPGYILDTYGKGRQINPQEFIYNPDFLELNKNNELITAVKNSVSKFFGNDAVKAIDDALKNAESDAQKPYLVVDALRNLKETLKDNELVYLLDNISTSFQGMARIESGRASQVNDIIRDKYLSSGVINAETKKFVQMYMATNENYNEQEAKVRSERSATKTWLEQHQDKSKLTGAQLDEYKKKEYELSLLNDLFDNVYKLTDKTTKHSYRSKWARVRITNAFDDILQMIIKAEDASKKVAGMTGYTEALNDFFKGLSDNNYMKQFYIEGGKPFEKMFEKFAEYGVDEFLPKGFSPKDLEARFREAGWEPGKELSTADFRSMYNAVVTGVMQDTLSNIVAKRNQYSKESGEYKELDSIVKQLDDFIIRATKQGETRWGFNEVEKKLEEEIKALNDIKTDVSTIKEKNSIFERAAKASNYLAASSAVYGKGYTQFNGVELQRGMLLRLLGAEGGKGIASTTAGESLMNTIRDGMKLNLANIGELLDIRNRIDQYAGSKYALDRNGNILLDENGNPIMNDTQFQETSKMISEGIKDLVDSLVDEYEKLMELYGPVDSQANSFINSARKYVDGIKRIDDAIKNGVLDKNKDADKIDRMRTNILQKNFEEISSQMPQWVKTFYAEDNGTTGISGKGFDLMEIFGGKDLETIIKDGIAKGYLEAQKRVQDKYKSDLSGLNKMLKNNEITQEQYDIEKGKLDENLSKDMSDIATKASGAMADASGVIAMVDMIVKAVYGAIKTVTTMLREITETNRALNGGLRLKKENGSYVDKNGNLNIGQNYYYMAREIEERQEAALEMIDTFNQHAMDGWEKLKSGDFMGAFTEIYQSFTDLIQQIAAYGDLELRQKQDANDRAIGNLANALKQLSHELQGEAGVNRWDNLTEQLANLEEQRRLLEENIAIENDMKSGDADKAKKMAEEQKEAINQIEDIIRGIQEEIFGTADNVASQLTDALVDAFRNGENAARSWRNAVRSYIGDVLKEVLMTKVVAPQIQNLLDKFMGGATTSAEILGKFSDVEKVTDLRNELDAVGTWLIDNFNNLPKAIQEMIAWNSNTSELSGGIQGITEDTARTLEGLANSMLAQLVLIQRGVMAMESSGFAQVQTSWFNDMINQQRAIRIATDSINDAIADMRNGVRPMKVSIAS